MFFIICFQIKNLNIFNGTPSYLEIFRIVVDGFGYISAAGGSVLDEYIFAGDG